MFSSSSFRIYNEKRHFDLNKKNSLIWSNNVLEKFLNIMSTHSVQIDLIDDAKPGE